MTANLAPNYDPDLAYKGGWVTVGLIRRPVLKVRPVDEPDEATPVCSCGALRHQACRASTGRIVAAHKGRTMPRTCRCGGAVVGRQTTCDDCLTRPRGRR